MKRALVCSVCLVLGCGVSGVDAPSLANRQPATLTAEEAELAVGRFMSAVAEQDEAHVLTSMTSRARDAAKAAGPNALKQLISLQRKGIVDQFNAKPQVARVEQIADKKWRVFFIIGGREHSKPAVLVREGTELLVSPFGDEPVEQPGQRRQAAVGDKYDFEWKLSNYTQNAAFVYCNNTQWQYGFWVNGSWASYTCPSWQCTWFGSTCTYIGYTACANQIFGDDWWYYGGDPGCYGPFY